jgi:hypothetical protein
MPLIRQTLSQFFGLKLWLLILCLFSLSIQAKAQDFNIEVVGSCSLAVDYPYGPYFPTSIAVDEYYAYVTAYHGGLEVVDITNPEAPCLNNVFDINGHERVYWDVFVYDRYAYVTSWFYTGLSIIDLGDQTQPVLSSALDDLAGYCSFIVGNNLYYVHNDSLSRVLFSILDITDKTNPIIIGSAPINFDPFEIFVDQYLVYMANEGASLPIYDISDPTNPVIVSNFDLGYAPESIFEYNGYVYTAGFNSCDNHINVIDAHDPLNPSIIDSCGTFTIKVRGEYPYLYGISFHVADPTDGLDVYSITDPAHPILVGSYTERDVTGGHITDVCAADEYIYIITESDTCRSWNLRILRLINTAADEAIIQPDQLQLLQNYPNPFNTQTTISYSLPQAGPVTLSIYNIMGQKVAVLFDGEQQAGEHKVVWDTGDVTSGVYFGRLESGNNNQNIKLILLR